MADLLETLRLLPPDDPERQKWERILRPGIIDDVGVRTEPQKDVQLGSQAKVERWKQKGEIATGQRAHTEYQRRPIEWIVKYLEIPESTLRWSLNPEYQNCRCDNICHGHGPHVWDGDVDPVVQALEAMSRFESVAVSSGTGTGKTFGIAAAGTLHFLGTNENSIVLSIAPKEDQLLKNMWKEIGGLFPKFKKAFPDADILTGVLRMRTGQGEKELWAASAFGAGVGADEEVAQRLAGFHHPRMLWLLEDMPGIHQAILQTIINTAVGDGNLIVGLGNPDNKFDTLGTFSAKKWVRSIRISALDHPNIVCQREVVPGAVGLRKTLEREIDYGRDDPIYMSRVRGIAPEQAVASLIRREWCDAAAARYDDQRYRVGLPALGVDPSNSEMHGKCAIARWQGACLTEVQRRVCKDANVLGLEIVLEARDDGIDPYHVGCDNIGIASGTVNKAKEKGFFLRGLNGSSPAETRIDEDLRYQPQEEGADPENPTGPVVLTEARFYNLRAQMWWLMREDLRLGRVALPNDPGLFDDLCIVTWKPHNGKILLQPKDDIIDVLGRSPDSGDAAVYGNWVRPRRPLAPEPKPQPERRSYDSAFARMMNDLAQRDDPTFSRRPF